MSALSEIARLVGGEIEGTQPEITGVAGIREAQPGDITFLAARRYQPYLASTGASAVLVGRNELIHCPAVRVENPALAFLKVVRHFSEAVKLTFPRTVHPTAVIDETAQIGRDVSIGAHVVIEGGVTIGDRTCILPGTCILRHSRLGADCLVYPNVVIREYTEIGDRVILHAGVVLGSDGFGFMTEGTESMQIKVPRSATWS
jgi:UDP-3-O-[3-hydroxymyristoyl] glucosamine N-acyltransferase